MCFHRGLFTSSARGGGFLPDIAGVLAGQGVLVKSGAFKRLDVLVPTGKKDRVSILMSLLGKEQIWALSRRSS
jgi:hypothetical protein